MNNSNKTPKPRFLIAVNKKTRLSVQIPTKLSNQISDYQFFHKEVSGEEATLDSLVSAFISAALTSDKSFLTWKKEKANRGADSAIDSTEDEIEIETENLYAKNDWRAPEDDFDVELEDAALKSNLTETQMLDVESDSTAPRNVDSHGNLFEITSSN